MEIKNVLLLRYPKLTGRRGVGGGDSGGWWLGCSLVKHGHSQDFLQEFIYLCECQDIAFFLYFEGIFLMYVVCLPVAAEISVLLARSAQAQA